MLLYVIAKSSLSIVMLGPDMFRANTMAVNALATCRQGINSHDIEIAGVLKTKPL